MRLEFSNVAPRMLLGLSLVWGCCLLSAGCGGGTTTVGPGDVPSTEEYEQMADDDEFTGVEPAPAESGSPSDETN